MEKIGFGKVGHLLAVGIALCLLPLQVAFGQPASQEITVLGAKLNLGMTKAAAFSPFNTYHVICLGSTSLPPECDSWIIQSNGPPYTPYANLYFIEGKLRSVWKYWERGFEGTQPIKFAETLHAILSQYGGTEMTIQTKEQIEN